MFRYLAIVWNCAHTQAASAAEHIGRAALADEAWTPALVRPGLQIYTHGSKPGVNGTLSLPGGQGVILGKLFRRRELDAAPGQLVALSHAEGASVLASGGQTLVDDFWGRYVAFLQSPSASTCVLRDPSGTLPCYLFRSEEVCLVFSWLEDALALLDERAPRAVNWDALATQLAKGGLIGHETALQGVTHVLPGERVDLHDGTRTLLWSAVAFARESSSQSSAEATHQLRHRVQACTAAWASCYPTVLARLSGGVDSSIMLACLSASRTPSDVIGLNYHSEGSDSDERRYARLTASHVGRDLVERERNREFRIDSVMRIARLPDPVPYVGYMNSRTDASLARAHGASAIFTGAGGDSVFYEIPRWWPAADYLATRGLDVGFPAAALDAARLGRLSVWLTIGLALRQWHKPDLAETHMMGHKELLCADHLGLDSNDPQRFMHPALLEAGDLPIGKYMQTIAVMYPLGYYDPFEQAAAPELVNPLLSQPLVELCLKLPTYLLTQGGRGRALVRRAFAQDLPAQIVNRRSKGGMEEHVKQVLLDNLDFVRGMLLDGQLAARGLIDRDRIAAFLSGRPSVLAAPIGQFHSLVAVEAWLSRWSR